jgi:hypothetical protein
MRMTQLVSKSVLAFTVVAAAVLALGASVAVAAPHFAAAGAEVNSAGALVVSFDERGLGNENIDYTLTADATALYACINRGGKNPSAANKQSFEGQVSGGASIEPKNGRVRASSAVGPLGAPQVTCPKGQIRELAQVAYSNIVLTDTTNGVPISLPPVSRCLLPDIPDLCV